MISVSLHKAAPFAHLPHAGEPSAKSEKTVHLVLAQMTRQQLKFGSNFQTSNLNWEMGKALASDDDDAFCFHPNSMRACCLTGTPMPESLQHGFPQMPSSPFAAQCRAAVHRRFRAI